MAIELPATIQLDGTSSSDPDGNIIEYKWEISDGRQFTGAQKQLEFDVGDADQYGAILTVTDDDGAEASDSVSFTLTEPPNDPPNAVANATPTDAVVPAEVEFTGRDSSDPDNNISSYAWEFDDGVTKSGKTVVRNFGEDAPQQVTGTLTVKDARGKTSTDSVTVSLSEPSGIVGSIDDETVAQGAMVGAGVASSLVVD
jgi:PKD repeat protein